jgi:hypothetical protein
MFNCSMLSVLGVSIILHECAMQGGPPRLAVMLKLNDTILSHSKQNVLTKLPGILMHQVHAKGILCGTGCLWSMVLVFERVATVRTRTGPGI